MLLDTSPSWVAIPRFARASLTGPFAKGQADCSCLGMVSLMYFLALALRARTD